MRKLFAKAQDRVSCETHAFGAAAALCGALVYVLRGMWTDAAVPAVAAAMCFCLSMAALYALILYVFCLPAVVEEFAATGRWLLAATIAMGVALFFVYDVLLGRLMARWPAKV